MIRKSNPKRTKLIIGLFFLVVILLIVTGLCVKKKIGTKKPVPSESPVETETSAAESEILFLEEYLHVHEIGMAAANDPEHPEDDADHCVRIAYLYRGRRPEITFVKFDNPRANAMFRDLQQEELRLEPRNGYQYARMEFLMDYSELEPGENVIVNSVTVSADGKETTLQTGGNLIFSRVRKEEERDREDYLLTHAIGEVSGISPLIPVIGRAEMPINVTLTGSVFRDITIQKLEIADWFRIMDSEVTVRSYDTSDAALMGKLEDVLPLAVPAKSTIQIQIWAEPKEEWSMISEFRTEMRLFYSEEAIGERVLPMPFEGNALLNTKWTNSIIDMATGGPSADPDKLIFLEDCLSCRPESYGGGEWMNSSNKWFVELLFLYRDEEETPLVQLLEIESEPLRKSLRSFGVEMSTFHEYRGYRVGAVRFEFDLSDQKPGVALPLGRIRLKVGTAEKTLDLAEGAVLIRNSEDWVYDPEIVNPVAYLYNRMVDEADLQITIVPTAPVTLQKIESRNVLSFSFEDIVVSKNGKEIGILTEVLPLSITEEDYVYLSGKVHYKDRDPEAVTYDLFLLYFTDKTGKAMISNRYALGGVDFYIENFNRSSKETVKRYMDYLIDKVEKGF